MPKAAAEAKAAAQAKAKAEAKAAAEKERRKLISFIFPFCFEHFRYDEFPRYKCAHYAHQDG
jgi:hypothetical protein